VGVKDKPSPISASPRKRVTIGAASIAGAKAEGNDERKAEAWRLRVEKGWPYRKIGAELGVDHVTAMKWCHAARDAHAETAADKIATVTEAAIERLTRAAAIAHEEYDRDRDPRQASVLSTIEARLAALVGADAPKRTEVTGPSGGPLRIATLTDEELAKLAGE
jgi:hypothetical protein